MPPMVARVGVLVHESLVGTVLHAYVVGDPPTPAKTLCGRRAFAGTSRGNVWRDLGPLDWPAAAARVDCPACRGLLAHLAG
jgi:hypothetical protein